MVPIVVVEQEITEVTRGYVSRGLGIESRNRVRVGVREGCPRTLVLCVLDDLTVENNHFDGRVYVYPRLFSPIVRFPVQYRRNACAIPEAALPFVSPVKPIIRTFLTNVLCEFVPYESVYSPEEHSLWFVRNKEGSRPVRFETTKTFEMRNTSTRQRSGNFDECKELINVGKWQRFHDKNSSESTYFLWNVRWSF